METFGVAKKKFTLQQLTDEQRAKNPFDHGHYNPAYDPDTTTGDDRSGKPPDQSTRGSIATVSSGGGGQSAASDGDILPWTVKLGYSCGNIYYEVNSTLWFSYTLLYYQVLFGARITGALILFGQIVDALFTPFIGFQADRNRGNWWGKRKNWFLIGVISLTIATPITYNKCIGCSGLPPWHQAIYFSFFIMLMKWGNACTSVGHVSLMTDLTQNADERVSLNAYRQISSILAGVSVYLMMMAMLEMDENSTFSEADLYVITMASYITCGVGVVFSIFFLLLVPEPDMTLNDSKKSSEGIMRMNQFLLVAAAPFCPTAGFGADTLQSKSLLTAPFESMILGQRKKKKSHNDLVWRDWFRKGTFWKVAILYMCVRLFLTTTQVYMPLYLKYTMQMKNDSLAILPFVTYITGFVFSLVAKALSSRIGVKNIMIIGATVGFGGCVWIFFGSPADPTFKQWQIYAIGSLFGIRGTFIVIASVAIVANLIGSNKISGAFVFSFVSFLDKFFNGAFIAIVQELNPNADMGKDYEVTHSVDYYRIIMSVVTGTIALFILCGVASIAKTNFKKYNVP